MFYGFTVFFWFVVQWCFYVSLCFLLLGFLVFVWFFCFLVPVSFFVSSIFFACLVALEVVFCVFLGVYFCRFGLFCLVSVDFVFCSLYFSFKESDKVKTAATLARWTAHHDLGNF